MSTLTLGGSTLANKTGSVLSLDSGVTFPAGHIVQTKFVAFDEVQTIGSGSTGTTFVNIGSGVSGKEFSIDMSVSSGNKIIGFVNVNINASGRYSALKVFYDSTQIALGEQTGSSYSQVSVSAQNNATSYDDYIMWNSSFTFNYAPSDTSSHTYTVKAGNTNNTGFLTYINRPERSDDVNWNHRGYSHFMLMEIAQ